MKISSRFLLILFVVSFFSCKKFYEKYELNSDRDGYFSLENCEIPVQLIELDYNFEMGKLSESFCQQYVGTHVFMSDMFYFKTSLTESPNDVFVFFEVSSSLVTAGFKVYKSDYLNGSNQICDPSNWELVTHTLSYDNIYNQTIFTISTRDLTSVYFLVKEL